MDEELEDKLTRQNKAAVVAAQHDFEHWSKTGEVCMLKEPTKRQKKRRFVRDNILKRRRHEVNHAMFKRGGLITQAQIDQWKLDEEMKRKQKEERKRQRK